MKIFGKVREFVGIVWNEVAKESSEKYEPFFSECEKLFADASF